MACCSLRFKKTASPQSVETPGLLQEIDDAWLAAHFVEHTASVNGALRSSREEASAEGSRPGEEHRGALRCGDEGRSFRQTNDMENREGVAGGKGRAACGHGGKKKGRRRGSFNSGALGCWAAHRGQQRKADAVQKGRSKLLAGARARPWERRGRRKGSRLVEMGELGSMQMWSSPFGAVAGASMAAGRAEASACSQGASAPARTKQRRRKMGRWWSAAGGRRRGAGGTAPLLAEGRKGAAAGRQPEVEEGLGSHGRKRVPAR
jgi:hypothetical protein|uniref:Uncharacterized protein n=1 Tax=Zea mays TaxID=4577 RepID=A0A804NAS6_MAIZE